MLDASCRGLGNFTLCTCNRPFVNEHFRLSSAEYPYPPLNASQRYLPPDSNHAGDLMCDCNTVMYR